ncbi:MAG: putative Fe-S cluster assembly protein SufT [Gammaproteobacteria bacterium]
MSSMDNEPVVIRRDVAGLMVPSGIPVTIPLDSLVYITQAMGGSFTVYFDGNLVRIPGIDADALGKEPVIPPSLPDDATDEQFEALVWEQLKTIYDPEIPINIVELGLVYECSIRRVASGQRGVSLRMTVTAPGCGMGEILVEEARQKISIIPTVAEVDVDLVFDPPWSQDMMSEAARLEAGLM